MTIVTSSWPTLIEVLERQCCRPRVYCIGLASCATSVYCIGLESCATSVYCIGLESCATCAYCIGLASCAMSAYCIGLESCATSVYTSVSTSRKTNVAYLGLGNSPFLCFFQQCKIIVLIPRIWTLDFMLTTSVYFLRSCAHSNKANLLFFY
jgi:hypothetical protein